MTNAQMKEAVIEFLKEFEDPDPIRLETVLADHFEYRVMGNSCPDFPFPNRLRARRGCAVLQSVPRRPFPTASTRRSARSSPGDHCTVQAESDAVAATGKKYANRYHFYFRFDGEDR